jgi:hypothetical protein
MKRNETEGAWRCGGEEWSKTVTITDRKWWRRSWRHEKEGREATMRRI